MKTIIGGTHIGLVRQNNQDRYRIRKVNDSLGVAVLCDGMGGTNGGGIAAQIAVDFAHETFEKTMKGSFLEKISEPSIYNLFNTIFTGANAQVLEKAKKEENLVGMGSTMILAVLHGNDLYVGWVGDSRVYLANETAESQLTKDHTVVQLMVDDGEITREEAAIHPKKHYITRAVGVSDSIQFDFLVQKINPTDIVLLCSDGLYDYIEAGEMHRLLLHCLEVESTDSLIELANSHGGLDNITAVIMI